MNPIRTVLVDDEPLALERLASLFDGLSGTQIVGTASNGAEAAAVIEQLEPDLVFLDIQMPEQNGLRVAADLPETGRPEIIFVTAFEHYAADAFAVEAADYLLKPVRFDRLCQAVERAKRRRRLHELARRGEALESQAKAKGPAHEDGFWVQTRGGANYLPTSAIEWVEAARDYVLLHTSTRSHIIRLSMRALEAKLSPEELMRVHRSAFARLSNVVEVQRTGRTISGLVLRDGAVVQVGPNYAKAVATRLNLDR